MSDKKVFSSTKDELANLKVKFEKVKEDTEDLISSAKHLSDTGMGDAKELIELAKEHLQELLSSFTKSAGATTTAQKQTAGSRNTANKNTMK